MIINKTKFLEFKSAKSPSGADWYYVRRTNDLKGRDSAVVITTLVKKDGEYNFLFLKTIRPPIISENKANFCLESPAGLIGDTDSKEDILKCAQKELLEEAGLKTDKIFIEMTNSSSSSGLSSETLAYTTAIVDNYKIACPPISDGGIIVERFLVPEKNIVEYLKNLDKTEFSVATATVCGIFFALDRIKPAS